MRNHRPLLSALGVALLAIAVGAAFVRLTVQHQTEERRAAAERVAVRQVEAMESELESTAGAIYALATALNRQADPGDFASAAAAVAALSPDMRNLFLVAGGQIKAAYPARAPGNELEGVLAGTWTGERDPLERANAPAVLGPVRLRNGEHVVVMRLPVDFNASVAAAEGWVAATLPLDRLLRSTGFDDLARAGYDYRVSYLDPASRQQRIFSRSLPTELEDPITKVVHGTDKQWRLSIVPRGGWLAWSPILLHGVVAGIIAFAVALLTYDLAAKAERFRQHGDKSRQRLQRTQRRLSEEILQREELEKQFNHAGFHDALTGLPNRRYFLDRLERSLRRTRRQPNYRVAVIVLDFDRFKSISDTLGHEAGDLLLTQAAKRFESCLRPDDLVVARVDSDEMALLLFDIRGRTAAVAAAQRLQGVLADPYDLAGQAIFAPASMGLAMSVSGYEQAEDLVRDAHVALSEAKSDGQSRLAVFESAARDQAVSSLQLEMDLHRAIEQQEFRLYYQPIVSLETGHIAGMEVLLRWQHPLEGLLFPDKFIRVAEETGLIVPITRWVLRAACEQARLWRAELPNDIAFYLSVNLAPQDFRQPDLGDYVAALLNEMALPAGVLRLEVTEGSLISNVQGASDLVAQFRKLGVPLLLDDFGTGYSSLSYLQRFQFDYLKIDRAFVSRITADGANTGIVRAIIHMATDLGMKTIAEGIETADIIRQLGLLGCSFGQGYYYSRPVTHDAAAILLESRRRWREEAMDASRA